MKKINYDQKYYDTLSNIATVEDITPESYKLYKKVKNARTEWNLDFRSVLAIVGSIILLGLASISFSCAIFGSYLLEPIFGGVCCTLIGGVYIGLSVNGIKEDMIPNTQIKALRRALKKSKDWKRISSLMQAYEQKQQKVEEQTFIAELKKSLEEAEKKKINIEERNKTSIKKVNEEISLIKRMLAEKENTNNNSI